jgi:hypothetical protein
MEGRSGEGEPHSSIHMSKFLIPVTTRFELSRRGRNFAPLSVCPPVAPCPKHACPTVRCPLDSTPHSRPTARVSENPATLSTTPPGWAVRAAAARAFPQRWIDRHLSTAPPGWAVRAAAARAFPQRWMDRYLGRRAPNPLPPVRLPGGQPRHKNHQPPGRRLHRHLPMSQSQPAQQRRHRLPAGKPAQRTRACWVTSLARYPKP